MKLSGKHRRGSCRRCGKPTVPGEVKDVRFTVFDIDPEDAAHATYNVGRSLRVCNHCAEEVADAVVMAFDKEPRT
jgi:RNase P subunit RPR2